MVAASGLSGAQCQGLVGPKIPIEGVPSAAATCRRPESFETAAAAKNLALTTLELGGKGAVVVFDDMPLERAIDGAAFAAFIAAGQTCTIVIDHKR